MKTCSGISLARNRVPTCCCLSQKLDNRIIVLIFRPCVPFTPASTPHRRSFWLMQSKNTFSGLALLYGASAAQNLMFSNRNDLVLGCTTKSPSILLSYHLCRYHGILLDRSSSSSQGGENSKLISMGLSNGGFPMAVDDIPD